MRSGKHPLFVRLDQREKIFKETTPNTLLLDAEKSQADTEFVQLFARPLDEQSTEFSNPQNQYARVFATLFSGRTVVTALSLLCAFIDRLLDHDYTATITALLPYAETIYLAAASHLKSHETETLQLQFFIRTTVLLFGALISEAPVEQTDEKASLFIARIRPVLQSNDLESAKLVMEGLKRFLRSDRYRSKFVEAGGVEQLLTLLAGTAKLSHTDTLYHILFAIWQLTYSAEGAGKLSQPEFVSALSRWLATVQPEREEIVRLLTAIIGQLTASTVFVENAYDFDILRLFRGFQAKYYVDPDLGKAIAGAAECLHQGLKHISLWDKYVRELKSGILHFSVSHKSEIFWKANLERFGDGNYAAVIALRDLLQSADEETVVVACHDLAEFATRSPVGRVKLEEIGAKEAVMRLMGSAQSQAIQREALRTTQLLLLRNQLIA